MTAERQGSAYPSQCFYQWLQWEPRRYAIRFADFIKLKAFELTDKVKEEKKSISSRWEWCLKIQRGRLLGINIMSHIWDSEESLLVGPRKGRGKSSSVQGVEKELQLTMSSIWDSIACSNIWSSLCGSQFPGRHWQSDVTAEERTGLVVGSHICHTRGWRKSVFSLKREDSRRTGC